MILGKIAKLATADPRELRIHGGDSSIDRLNSVVTFYLMLFFALLVQAGQLIGDPVRCWCPAHFTGTHSEFANAVCWTTNTYYLPYSEEIPKNGERHDYISYYQWVALMLSGQAMLFFLPRPMWRSISSMSGVAIATITDAAIQCQQQRSAEDRDKAMRYMVKMMGKFLSKLNKSGIWALRGHFMPIAYIFIKVVYLANAIGQLFLINAFLSMDDYHLYGVSILKQILRGEQWMNSKRFPRVTMCDFKIRLLGNVQNYTVQCALPMNLFNEIIYIFIWFWFVMVATATSGSLLLWLISTCSVCIQKRYIKKRLNAMDKVPEKPSKKEKAEISKFVSGFLRGDGYFMIQMVSKNSSDLIAAELIAGLWDHYQTRLRANRLAERLEECYKKMNGSPPGSQSADSKPPESCELVQRDTQTNKTDSED